MAAAGGGHDPPTLLPREEVQALCELAKETTMGSSMSKKMVEAGEQEAVHSGGEIFLVEADSGGGDHKKLVDHLFTSPPSTSTSPSSPSALHLHLSLHLHPFTPPPSTFPLPTANRHALTDAVTTELGCDWRSPSASTSTQSNIPKIRPKGWCMAATTAGRPPCATVRSASTTLSAVVESSPKVGSSSSNRAGPATSFAPDVHTSMLPTPHRRVH